MKMCCHTFAMCPLASNHEMWVVLFPPQHSILKHPVSNSAWWWKTAVTCRVDLAHNDMGGRQWSCCMRVLPNPCHAYINATLDVVGNSGCPCFYLNTPLKACKQKLGSLRCDLSWNSSSEMPGEPDAQWYECGGQQNTSECCQRIHAMPLSSIQ